MNYRAANAYKKVSDQTAVSEATPLELIILVYKRLIDHLREAQQAIESGADSAVPTEKALDLIQKGLVASLDTDKGGEIATNLAALYEWSMREILQARLKKNSEILTGVVEVFKSLESAWVEISVMRAADASDRVPSSKETAASLGSTASFSV
jgi:flagellar protein FliS